MFELTKPQKEVQKAAKAFAKGEFDKDLASTLDKECEFPLEIWKKAVELGFVGIHFPESVSGGGMGLLENAIVIEELCRSDPSLGIALAMSVSGADCLGRFGSEPLKAKFLAQVLQGKTVSGKAFAEEIRIGNYLNIRTKAVVDGDRWVINGSKRHVTNGNMAGFFIVLCQTGEDADPLPKKYSMFLVESDRAGLTINPNGKKLGCNLMSTADLKFENVAIPAENLVGNKGSGYTQLRQVQMEEQITIAAQALGTALASFDRMLVYVKGREQFGKKLAEFQVSKQKIADMATKIELSRLVLHKAAWKLDSKSPDSSLTAMAMISACRSAMEIGSQTIQLFGGYGYMTEYEVERFYREAKALDVMGGAREVQKDLIANTALGKIR